MAYYSYRFYAMVLLCVCLCFVAIPIHVDKPEVTENKLLFSSFMKKYNKSWAESTQEYQERLLNFQNSLKIIHMLNKNRRDNSGDALYGLTEYSHMSQKEFMQKHLKYHKSLKLHRNKNYNLSKRNKRYSKEDLPISVDWRKKGIITDVKNQKTCGACWAFSTIETIESMYAIRTKILKNLSVQEVIDCAGNGNLGCDGGDICALVEWLVSNHIKIMEEKDYPSSLKTEVCKIKSNEDGIQVASNYSCKYFNSNENDILQSLAEHGPVAVAVNALYWQYYISGIIQQDCNSSLFSINHAVQLIGYDLTGSIPFYIARNSWGKSFGESGYLKLSIGNNICGITTEVVTLDVIV